MDQSIIRALTGSRDHPVLGLVRVYRAEAADLRDACTDTARLARWFGTVTGDPAKVGDTFEATLSDDPNDRATGRVLRCADDEVAVTWSWQGEPTSQISARFRPVEDGHTELTLRHELEEPAHAAGYGGGWEQTLQALARALGVADPDAPADDVIESTAAATWRTITRAPLELEHPLDADAQRVWAALATEEGLRTWWWVHWDDVTIDADVRPGGSYRIAAPGVGIVLDGRYLGVVPPDDRQAGRLSMTWRWSDADGTSVDEAVEIGVLPESAGTLLTVRHSGPWSDDAPAEDYRQGWSFVLQGLTAAV
ncbi:SRPBCC family protein [Parenemella sanctibonifatiensis]|uniref:Activator of Hsp90 ATPase homologue 1/2-like C-terminal domain-containing protein n=1 Tax=Parenemella sanctibonifatiensis TaxID=2016505 RepID=A0A255EN92_9ACTN|nr:SRPBCC family protein [Parenemella sanctibonifatiensis]OYN92690.1 hypothetical protein CGZ91_04265 [Parenemella sanctibonifatiensis]